MRLARSSRPFLFASATLVLGTLGTALSGCAHHRDVRPGEGGINRVVVRAPDKESAERSAIAQANDFCEERHQFPSFIKENTQYTGSMDENARDTIRRASTAAQVLGGVPGYGMQRNKGRAVLGDAGTAGAIMTNGDDYVSDMTFRCQ